MTLGERLRFLRKEKRKTLREVNTDTGIDYSGLAQIERGERSCNSSTLDILARYYNVSADYLLGNTDNPNPTKIVDIEVWEQDGTITKLQHELLDLTKGFTVDDFQMVNSYIEFLKSKKDEGKNEK